MEAPTGGSREPIFVYDKAALSRQIKNKNKTKTNLSGRQTAMFGRGSGRQCLHSWKGRLSGRAERRRLKRLSSSPGDGAEQKDQPGDTRRKKKIRKNPHLSFLKAPIWRLHMACVAQSRSQTDEIFKEPGACRQEGWVEQDCLLKKQICNNNYGMFFLYQCRSLVTLSIWGWGAKRQDFPEESSA